MIIKHFLIGSIGTNCYLVWDEGSDDAFLIDPAQNLPEIAQAIREEFLNLKYVILTHGHGDHIGGVTGILAEFPDAKLAAGRMEAELLAQARMNFSLEITGKSVSLVPDIFLNDGDELSVGNLTLAIIETPGHTPGGISILVNREVLFSGDTLFRDSIGRTDLAGGNYERIVASIREKLFVLPDEVRVYPGHMDETTIGHEKKFNPYV
ncbi:MAG: MBL fold metallo-hydrolase [Clostridiales Family XIII bacterium]|jgi:glyoxylase-like metal-dependent hydrolase (beta-lactamase superfamily II)|nr:MBL fold metallo-hydrolase [Clostridiales Family XIII bacterium]